MKETAVMVLVMTKKNNMIRRRGEGNDKKPGVDKRNERGRVWGGGGGAGGEEEDTDSDRKRWRKTDGRAKMRLNTT